MHESQLQIPCFQTPHIRYLLWREHEVRLDREIYLSSSWADMRVPCPER